MFTHKPSGPSLMQAPDAEDEGVGLGDGPGVGTEDDDGAAEVGIVRVGVGWTDAGGVGVAALLGVDEAQGWSLGMLGVCSPEPTVRA